MKPIITFRILLITLLSLPLLLKAQVSESSKLTQNELIIQKNADFDELITKDYSFTEEIGNPQLPIRIESFVVPFDAVVSELQITSITKQIVKGKFYIYPTQPPRPLDGSEPPTFIEPNPTIYNSSAPYPGKTVEIISDEFMHGYHIVTVKIYLVEYIPKDREVYIQDIDFTLLYTSSKRQSSDIMQPEKQSYIRAELAKKFIKGYVKNKDDVENFRNEEVIIIKQSKSINYIESVDKQIIPLKSTSAVEELVPDYIIITSEALKPTFQTLADWKTKKGIPAIIKTVEEIYPDYTGSDLPEKIRNYLKEAFSKWGADLFILLGGDVNVVPPRMVISDYNGIMKPTDLYYTTIGGTWNANNNNKYNESGDNADYGRAFYLGRASVENIQEATTFVNKIINYEKANNISTLSYFNNIVIADAFIEKNECDNRHNDAKSGLKQICTDYMSANINRWFMFDNYNCSSGPYAYSPYLSDYCNPNKPTVKYYVPGGTCTSGNVELSNNNFFSALNNGGSSGLGYFHIVYHMDHSGEKGMGTSSLDKNQSIKLADFDNLTNGSYQQILMTGGCKPATFTQDCMGERYINNANGGGVAFIGNSDVGWSSEWTQLRGFANSIYETTGHPSSGRFDIGCAFQSAIGRSSSNWRLTLLGDPEMQIWTNIPQTFNVSVSPTTVVNGEDTIVVTVNNLPVDKTATICLQKDDEGYAVQTISSNGSYQFVFTPHTPGQIDVTVTAHNFIPYESTITVNTNQNQNLYISDLTFDDDTTGNSNGNNDWQIDAGETIELTVELNNNGVATALNVSATLTCNFPYITILNGQSGFGNIDPGDTTSSFSKYVFTIDKDAPEILVNDLNPVKFILQISDGASNSYTDVFNIDVFEPVIEQANKTIVTTTNGDKIIEPNDTVTINIDLFNKGKAQATGITCILSGNSSYITSCSTTPGSYPEIGKFETGTNTPVYQFTVSSSYTVGQPLDFILLVENEYGKTWPFNFNLLDKPTKPDSLTIDFTAGKTDIELFWPPVTGITGYFIYRSDVDSLGNEVGNYVRINTFPVQAAYFKDYGLEELTMYYYKISAVSYSGNESLLSGRFLAWTSYPLKGLFPVQMDVGTSIQSSINVADINNDNMLEIFTAIKVDERNSYIIGLHHDGTEIFDIDGNVTTYSGFVHVDGNIESHLVIGDLNITGEYQILSGTRDEGPSPSNYLYAHSVNDSDSDGLPDLIWQYASPGRSYRGPVISNLDNSPDGSKEVLYFCEGGQIRIYSSNGQLLQSMNTSVSYGAPAVADLDNDGDKEIIAGTYNGIYIFHHDGTNYGVAQPFFTLPGYRLRSSVIVCDLDNNGDKEILTSALLTSGNQGRIVAIHHNGSLVNGWDGSQTIPYPNDWHSQEISVGDLDIDGNLEVVALGSNVVKVWNNSGTLISSTAVTNLNPGKLTPLLADADGDPEIEIIFGSWDEGIIYALKMDGSKVLGFPLKMDDGFLATSICVADVDKNGKNEIITAAGDKVYMWETEGSPEYIEWGSERHDMHNTGEYFTFCTPTVITAGTIWSSDHILCGDLIIESGTLTIESCNLQMDYVSTIIIKSGGELIIDAGSVLNANIKAMSGSNVVITNNGIVLIRDSGEFYIHPGATFDFEYGFINVNP